MLGIYSWRRQPDKDAHRAGLADPALRPAVAQCLRSYAKMAAISAVLIWTGLSLFYGAVYQRTIRAHHITLHVIDLDRGAVGANVTRMVLDAKPADAAPTWARKDGLRSLEDAKAWVLRHGWGALVINPGATSRLYAAVRDGADYDPAQAMTAIESSGRQVVAEMMFASPAVVATAQRVSRDYSVAFLAEFQRALPQAPPQANYAAIVAPVAFTTVDVAPAGFSLSPIMSTFGYLVALFCAMCALLPWKLTSFAFFARVRYRDLVLMWSTLILCLALVLSLYQALAFLVFRGPDFDRLALPYTPASFFKLWFTCAAVVLAFALWLFALFLLLPPYLLALPTICTVVTNVISTITAIELAPPFYRFLYAMPFFNGSNIALHVITGAHPDVRREVAILVAEIAAMAVFLAFSVWLRRLLVQHGLSDPQGWYRGQTYFRLPAPPPSPTPKPAHAPAKMGP
ncbi:hypothetical protein H4R18_003806 [Coemansia javaensis]|uniref:DUF3533 domain-containing protein n=1 Tax=Coemansia javaensis TaxID=2761396 RepID=A0A9W8LGP8_9FUNG|nr:hypothetical protein H4R18_003806 [Coemansia javaensis]